MRRSDGRYTKESILKSQNIVSNCVVIFREIEFCIFHNLLFFVCCVIIVKAIQRVPLDRFTSQWKMQRIVGLEHVSKSVILHEKISTSESLVHAVMLDFSARACASVSDVLQISISLFHRLCSIGKRRCKIRGLSNGSVAQRLPPRPPLKLWDVPRFIGYCKTMGLLGYSGSFVATWKLFGPVLLATYPPAKTHGWSKDVVGPLPIEVSVEKVVELLEHFPVEAGCNPGDSIGCVIRQVIAPFLCGFF